MASVSKQFTAAAIYLLFKEGKLSLSQPLADFFPDFNPVAQHITVEHLLTHTSGIRDYEEMMPPSPDHQLSDGEILEMVMHTNETYFPAGSAYRYSNTAYCLLTLIIERVSGEKYDDFMDKSVFKPLGMNFSTIYENQKMISQRAWGYALNEQRTIVFSDQSPTSATKGDGGVYTSLSDYLLWIQNRSKVLTIDPILQFESSHAAIFPNQYYSFGWFVSALPKDVMVFSHTGSTCGFSHVVIDIPAEKTAVICFTNLSDNHNDFYILEKLLIQEGVLPAGYSVKKLHETTN